QVVEAQHADALAGELLAYPARGRAVLAEGEAVCEDTPPPQLSLGQVDQTGQHRAGGTRKPDALRHALADQLRVELRDHPAEPVLPVHGRAADKLTHQPCV